MGKKLKSTYFVNSGEAPQTFEGVLGSTTVEIDGEPQERRTVECADAIFILPTHAALVGILAKLPDGTELSLTYAGMVGPESKKYGKPTAKWSGELK